MRWTLHYEYGMWMATAIDWDGNRVQTWHHPRIELLQEAIDNAEYFAEE